VSEPQFFEELPPTSSGQGRGRYGRFASECRRKPFVWGKLPRKFHSKNQCSNVTTGIKRGEYADFRPKGEWEAAQRNGEVFVRFVGKSKK